MAAHTLSVEQRVAHLDTTLFDHVEAQLDPDDRRSLLALHAACSASYGRFSYLEIGSHLGGSLQALICDPACESITSIDSRPDSQPDERGLVYRYPGNSTSRMLENLAAIPGADLDKLVTLDTSTVELDPDGLARPPELCLVDGEHTDTATLRDARFCRQAMRGRGCIVFHDAAVIYRALDGFTAELRAEGAAFCAYVLPANLFVIELERPRLLPEEPLATVATEAYRAYLGALLSFDPYRQEYRRLEHRALRRLRRALRR